MSLTLGLDIGTSGGRCVVLDEVGTVVSAASRPWTYRTEGPGIATLDPDVCFNALVSAAREAVARVNRRAVAGIGVASQRTGVVLLDGDGSVIYAGPNADGRAAAEGIALEREHGPLVYARTGRLPILLYLPARLAWLRANRPGDAARVRHAFAFSDWAVHRLTGAAATEPTQAAEMLVYDLAQGGWSADLARLLGVPLEILPDIRPPGTPAGGLTAEMARLLGLEPDVPVCGAGADTQCAALALGVLTPGSAAVVAGTTMLCQQPVAQPGGDGSGRLWRSPGPAGGLVLEAHCGEAGALLDWLAALIGVDHRWIDEAAAGAPPGAGGVVLTDPQPVRMSDYPLICSGSIAFPTPVLALGRGREDLARAALEGIAFAARAGLDWTEEEAGSAEDVAVTGGVARSATFLRILATALGRPVRTVAEASASARGAAIVAAVAAGIQRDSAGAAAAMRRDAATIEPDGASAGATEAAYHAWSEQAARAGEAAIRISDLIAAGTADRGGGERGGEGR